MKLHPYLSLYSKIIFRWTKDLDFKFETSKVLEENVSSILQSVGVEMYCPNRTPFAQELRQTVDNWNLVKLKKTINSVQQRKQVKKKSSEWKRIFASCIYPTED